MINKHMKMNGRVLVCGSISTYNKEPGQSKKTFYRILCLKFVIIIYFFQAAETNVSVLMKELSVYGFVCFNCYDRWPEAFVELNQLIRDVII